MPDLFYTLGRLAGSVLPPPPDEDVDTAGLAGPLGTAPPPHAGAGPSPSPPEPEHHTRPTGGEGGVLVDTALAGAVAWAFRAALRPRSVSWPRVVVAGIGATVLAEILNQALDPSRLDGDPSFDEDPDALLVRLGSGVAMAAAYASLLYPRLPGSPLARGFVFGVMELAAAPYGGLIRVATDTPGLKFPLKDLAVPEDARGPLANLAFGLAVGVLYRPSLDD